MAPFVYKNACVEGLFNSRSCPAVPLQYPTTFPD